MLQNTGKLAGYTVFITGASRGIGKAIALKAARDGANVVIAAKTADPHPKLPGTIYTAAAEIEAAGGKALPCIVDVRDEKQINDAVGKAVEKFGGIDILVNNASAINLTGTLETPMKKVDLMLGINLRGTYLTSKLCIPHLLKSKNPHILNLSPPLNLNPIWFKNHTAYTMAKYGMSMCVLGMAEEFKGSIAVNALWPKTGNDFPASLVQACLIGFGAEICRTVALQEQGDHAGVWYIDLKNDAGSAGSGEPPVKADVVMTLDSSDFIKMFGGKLKPTMAFMSGKLKIKGDMGLAMKLDKMMGMIKPKL
ncbi:hydroxysteroid dehydrogenase-like protein 2 [Sinocyclocheilus grahami]|uniref:hydroxysteroid dehydrogenase-like protein 2 n=1 Tax=Sinocyclocheilus grahami TaxID=75366 RepID=UPI0007ACD27F|nr:PREDICTED: hydroxysteroid dehydrogenase-like protein 2 [Sinocyclocheilus grahami]